MSRDHSSSARSATSWAWLHRPGEPVLTIDVAANAVMLDIPLLREVYELEIGYNA